MALIDQQSEDEPTRRPAASRDSGLMLAALGMLAYLASVLTHEALGHGGFCLATGGQNTALTAWWETCRFPGAAPLAIKAAGPCAQFGAGLVAWWLLHRVPPRANRLRCLLWLFMGFSLLIPSGYLAFSGVTGLGDAAELVSRLRPAAVWRVALLLLGGALYVLSMLVTASELQQWAGPDRSSQRLSRLVWIPYLAAGLLACAAAVLTQTLGTTGSAAETPALNGALGRWSVVAVAALSSFGAGSGILALPAMRTKLHLKTGSPASFLTWSTTWALVVATVILAFLIVIGPGLH